MTKIQRMRALREQIHAAALEAVRTEDWTERVRLLAELREVEKEEDRDDSLPVRT
jgi:hypothetical protein